MSEIKVDTLTGKTTANDITVTVGATATQSLEQGLVKSFVYLNGTGTPAVRNSKSFNISSVTDTNTGQYSSTLTNNHDSADYGVSGGNSGDNSTANRASVTICATGSTTANTSSTYRYATWSASASNYLDTTHIGVITHGDLA